MIPTIVLALTVDFGRFWDREAQLKMKVRTGLYVILLRGNDIFESNAQRVFLDFSDLYAPVCTNILDTRRDK